MFLDRPNMNFEKVDFINNDIDQATSIHLSIMVTLTWTEIFFQRTIVNCPQRVQSFQGYQDIDTEKRYGVGNLEKDIDVRIK